MSKCTTKAIRISTRIEKTCEMKDLHIQFENDLLHVSKDKSYLQEQKKVANTSFL